MQAALVSDDSHDNGGHDEEELRLRVNLAEAFFCPLLKNGKGGRLPPPHPDHGFNNTDLSSCDDAFKALWDDPETCAEALIELICDTTVGIFPLFLDESRRQLVENVARAIHHLDHGTLFGNGHGRIAIGPKGIGKSSLLQALVCAVQILARHTIAVWVDCSVVSDESDLSDVLVKALDHLLPEETPNPLRSLPHRSGGELNFNDYFEALRAFGLNIVIILDEFHTIYAKPEARGNPWTRDVYGLGNRNAPINHFLLLSGSAPYMRSLCFGKMAQDATKFPSYRGLQRNLNSQRFRVIDLVPISTRGEMDAFVAAFNNVVSETLKVTDDKAKRNEIFALTGGVYRCMMQQLLADGMKETPRYQLQQHWEINKQTWQEMLSFLVENSETPSEIGALKSDLCQLVQWMPVACVPSLSGEEGIRVAHQGHDRGAFLFRQTQYGDEEVRFVTPAQAIFPIDTLHLEVRPERPLREWFDS